MRRGMRIGCVVLIWMGVAMQGAGGAELPRLAGIVIGPARRVAIFVARGGDETLSLTEGERIEGYVVQSIAPQEVVLLGPDGARTVALAAGTDQPAPAPPAEAATVETTPLLERPADASLSIARLALTRDRCARGGLLAGIPAGAEEQLGRMIGAMRRLPVPQGSEGGRAVSTRLAEALAAGLESARREVAPAEPDGAACARTEAAWERVAGQYGLR